MLEWRQLQDKQAKRSVDYVEPEELDPKLRESLRALGYLQ